MTDAPTLTPTITEAPTQAPVTTDGGEHERLAHIVLPASAVTEAYITGTPVTGKQWVPERDPKRYPICETCKEILNGARARQGKPPI